MKIVQNSLKDLNCEWKEFAIIDWFHLELSKGDLQPKNLKLGNVPLISAGNFNNGVVMKIKKGDGKAQKFQANVITIDMFGKAFYQNNEFYAVSHGRVNIVIPKFQLNYYGGLFIVAIFNKAFENKFGFDKMCSYGKLKEQNLFLPIDFKGNPNFALMESFIKDIQAKHASKLIAYYKYLKLANHNSCAFKASL
ncbi:restriction endonuclease subunit S [Campylobacter helveticus]|uniref:restriction endonuclease subunit S n=1 Tax=Campylobacter helveticus TaxID=28898 RepID=UPI00214A584E|nr:restriction endonuclease subunit S [Campylobacter helveticus]MCR2061270.1 restriction endonuclease subunit S [Campylobacter helveticus]